MRRHIWYPYLAGAACIACGVFKRPDTVTTSCEGREEQRGVEAEQAPHHLKGEEP